MCETGCLQCGQCEKFKAGCRGQSGTFNRDMCPDILKIPVYLDDNGCEISISQGIGGSIGDWLIFRRKKSGILQRIKTVPPIPFEHKDMAIKTLEAYAAKKKYRFKEKRERL